MLVHTTSVSAKGPDEENISSGSCPVSLQTPLNSSCAEKIASNEDGFFGRTSTKEHIETEEQSFSTEQLCNHRSLT